MNKLTLFEKVSKTFTYISIAAVSVATVLITAPVIGTVTAVAAVASLALVTTVYFVSEPSYTSPCTSKTCNVTPPPSNPSKWKVVGRAISRLGFFAIWATAVAAMMAGSSLIAVIAIPTYILYIGGAVVGVSITLEWLTFNAVSSST